ncbi:MAG: hypothetical protein VX613_00820, partial [Candidatus Thermoplasmatota archaeon]|nr:hypothetical protein [Candidatus Thermoplasmatota archaeon]
FTYISSKSELAWNWDGFEFEDEKTYFDWLDRLGIMSILFIISGIIWIMETANVESLTWGIISIYLATVAIQGFQEETDSGWRRSIGGFGSILSLFILSSTIENSLYQSLTWLALGIVAFGFGMMYMQRFGDQTDVFVEEDVAPIEEVDENIPEAVTEVVEEDVAPIVEEDVEEEVAPVVEEDVEEEVSPVVEEDVEEEVAPVVEEEVAPIEDLIKTDEGFFFRLSPDILKNIRGALENTPHEGFKPILEFNADGQIVLNFE